MLQVDSPQRYSSPKILTPDKAARRIATLKKSGKVIGLCQGGYDLLHPGHITHFESAKKACDVLIVSVTPDRFVAGRKGVGRPIFTDQLRAYMIASLSCVDYVTVTDFKSGVDVINLIKPSKYIKGPDFVGKTTPGIIAERQAIEAIGGTIFFTNDPKLSTTEILSYIKKNIFDEEILLLIDRDGTLVEDSGFFGRDPKWKDKLIINSDVASLLYYLQTRYPTTKIVVSNQAGVARGFFTEQTVRDINATLAEKLTSYNVKISGWEYCPDVDTKYATSHPEYKFVKKYIKDVTKRKPSSHMVDDALGKLNRKLGDFSIIIVIGDRDEDKGLADTLKGDFLDVKGKTYKQMLDEFEVFIRKRSHHVG